MYPVCTRPLMCMLLGFEAMHLPPNVALFAFEDNQSSAKNGQGARTHTLRERTRDASIVVTSCLRFQGIQAEWCRAVDAHTSSTS